MHARAPSKRCSERIVDEDDEYIVMRRKFGGDPARSFVNAIQVADEHHEIVVPGESPDGFERIVERNSPYSWSLGSELLI